MRSPKVVATIPGWKAIDRLEIAAGVRRRGPERVESAVILRTLVYVLWTGEPTRHIPGITLLMW